MKEITKSVINAKSITVVIKDENGKSATTTIKSSDDRFTVLKRYIEAKDHPPIFELLDTAGKVEMLSEGAIKRKGKGLSINDEDMPPGLCDKIRAVVSSDYDPAPFVHFWERLKQNPSEHSKRQFFKFIQNCDCNITNDGYVIVYKGVRKDLLSNHNQTHRCKDGTEIEMMHKPGTFLEIPRGDAVDDPSVACSYGLHCAPWKYVKDHYSNLGTIVELRLDPKDVVSIPNDGNGSKMRVCKYEILRIMEPGMKPYEDVLQEMTRKDTPARKASREKASTVKSVTLEFGGDNLVLPPEVLLAVGIEPKDSVRGYFMEGYGLIGKESDTQALSKQVDAKKGKFSGARVIPLPVSVRTSIALDLTALKAIAKDGETYTEYTAKVVTLGGKKMISIVPNGEETHQTKRVKGVKANTIKEKAQKKLSKKVAKKAAKKAPKKKAVKPIQIAAKKPAKKKARK